ncbi:hypothetical protein [Thalassolituus sp. C2-1]|uniref:hypothetical protein n=1 Tax=Venatorbacter sp. C2-1 TaxID=2597518 RepID=UPI0016491F8B|nr:hypothetical protein [Thalassolituus sp. C2-1]
MRIKRVSALPEGVTEDLSTDENGIKKSVELKVNFKFNMGAVQLSPTNDRELL